VVSWGLRLKLKRSNSRTEQSMSFSCALDGPMLPCQRLDMECFWMEQGRRGMQAERLLSDEFALDFWIFHCGHELFQADVVDLASWISIILSKTS